MIICARVFSALKPVKSLFQHTFANTPFQDSRDTLHTMTTIHIPFEAPVSVMCLLPRLQYHGSIPQTLHLDVLVQSCRAGDLYRAASDSQCSLLSLRTMEQAVLSVLVNPKDPHSMQLWQFGNENSQQGHRVDHKMDLIIFGVEAGEDV